MANNNTQITTGTVVKVGIVALILLWLFGQNKKWNEVDQHLKNLN